MTSGAKAFASQIGETAGTTSPDGAAEVGQFVLHDVGSTRPKNAVADSSIGAGARRGDQPLRLRNPARRIFRSETAERHPARAYAADRDEIAARQTRIATLPEPNVAM